MNPFVADLRDWPILRLRSPNRDVDVKSFFTIIDEALEKQTRFVSIHDTRGMPSLTSSQRRQFADYIASREEILRKYIAAHAVVSGSAIERGIVTAVLWLRATPFPVKMFSSPAEAEAWVTSLLHLPPEQPGPSRS